MKKYDKLKPGQRVTIPSMVEFFSVDLRTHLTCAESIDMKITYKCLPGKGILCGRIIQESSAEFGMSYATGSDLLVSADKVIIRKPETKAKTNKIMRRKK